MENPMAILKLEKKDKVAVIEMTNGKNTQTLAFAQTLNKMVEEIRQDDNTRALVISSTDEKNWSQGIDLEWMHQEKQAGNEENITEFFVQLDQVYNKLMLLPVPVIAAINGHAFGAGAFLATACDYRFMNAQKGFFCFPEIDLKMDFLPGVFKMMVHKLPDFKLPDLLYTGKRATAVELEKCFIVDKACDGMDDTNRSSMEFAKNLDKDRNLIAAYKQKLHGSVAAELVKLDLEYLKAQQQT
jgi:enoyl-CoA hydratase/carnithine racemase